MGSELRRVLVNRKEKYLNIEAVTTKLEAEVEDITKKINNINCRLEQATIALKQVKFCENYLLYLFTYQYYSI